MAAKSKPELSQTLCFEQEKHFVYALGPFIAQPAKEGNQLIPGSLATAASSTDEVSISHPTDGRREQQPTLPNGLLLSLFPNLIINARRLRGGTRSCRQKAKKLMVEAKAGLFEVCWGSSQI